MSASFFHVVFFSAAVWPVVCYAAHATTEKLCAERLGGRPLATHLSNAAVWTLGAGLLVAAAQARWAGRPSVALEYSYVGAQLAYAFFHTPGAPDWDRLGLVAFAFVCAVYTWTDGLLLWYSVVFAFFRALHALFPALETLAAELALPAPGRPGPAAMRAAEFFILAALCGRAVWASGALDPVVFALNFATVYGHRFPRFVRKIAHEKM